MAAVSNNDRPTYRSYVRQLDACQVASRTASVVTFSGIGAGVGAAIGIGSGPGALGTVPACAGLGAGVGAVVGIAVASAYDASEYRKFKKSLTDEARANLDQFIAVNGEFSQDNICGITQEVPCDPVVIKGEPQVYEKKFILRHIKDKGDSPMTRKKITEKDLAPAHEHMAKTGNFCAQLLNDPAKRAQLTPTLLKGIALLQKDNDKRAERFIQKSHDDSSKRLRRGKLSLEGYVKEAQGLADLFKGSFGEVSLRKRHKLNIGKIAVDQLDLRKNQGKFKASEAEEKKE